MITGITGQDGSYLAEFLLNKGYIVHGIKENHLHLTLTELIIFIKIFHYAKFFLHYGDLTDSNSLFNVINKIRPNEIYNLGAQKSSRSTHLKFQNILQKLQAWVV